MKSNIKSIIVLPVICLVVAALLAAVNHITEPIIEKNALLAEQESLRVVLPGSGEFEKQELSDDIPETVTGLYKEIDGKGYAVTLETTSSYSQNPMTFTVGFSAEGKITGVEVTNYSETKDFGAFPESFIGKDSALEGVDMVAGVTYSSKAFKDAVLDAFAALSGFDPNIGGDIVVAGPYEPSEEILRKVFPSSSGNFEKLETSGEYEAVSAVYRMEGFGYAVAFETSSQYSLDPMTGVVGISSDGKITAVEIDNYSESKDFGAYPDGFIGKDSALEGVDVAAGVTYSSKAFKEAVAEAFKAVEEVAGK
ncbi:MAG: FMN-binding protein [Ruminococcaceae bacterium]|nr:FMN-binding protein [Oscillospiraceae bacterium]